MVHSFVFHRFGLWHLNKDVNLRLKVLYHASAHAPYSFNNLEFLTSFSSLTIGILVKAHAFRCYLEYTR